MNIEKLKREGGDWLLAARSWIQRRKLNGSTVTWGSQDKLKPPMTVSECEDLAAHVAAAQRERCAQLMISVCGHDVNPEPGCT